MSKKYQYFAKKRDSHLYRDANSLCNTKVPNNYINCEICLRRRVGNTRQKQKINDNIKTNLIYSNYL